MTTIDPSKSSPSDQAPLPLSTLGTMLALLCSDAQAESLFQWCAEGVAELEAEEDSTHPSAFLLAQRALRDGFALFATAQFASVGPTSLQVTLPNGQRFCFWVEELFSPALPLSLPQTPLPLPR